MTALDRFEIHYYLANESHAMDAFVRNKCEAELLAILQEVCSILGASIKVETIPLEEGGLKEYWKVREWPEWWLVWGRAVAATR